jgi:two-component system chemotaxis response regulator CheY
MPLTLDLNTPIFMVTAYREVSALIRRVANELGFHDVFEVWDAGTALERVREQATFGLVIADWTVAPSGGLALLQQMRTDEKLKPWRFIMMSGMVSKEGLEATKAAGADDFIIKPFSIHTLKRKLLASLGTA